MIEHVGAAVLAGQARRVPAEGTGVQVEKP